LREGKDSALCFGRDAQIVRGLDKMRGLVRTGVERMLIILGASGSGKSSFLRAGLWPRLKRDDRNWLPLPVIRPERAAMSGKFGLAQALLQTVTLPQFVDRIRQLGLPRSRADIQEFIEKTDDGLLRIFAALRDIAQVPGRAAASGTRSRCARSSSMRCSRTSPARRPWRCSPSPGRISTSTAPPTTNSACPAPGSSGA